jgi:hypothetical protein
MAEVVQASATPYPAASPRFHAVMRFAAGTAGAFVLCEAMGWYPTFLAPLLAGVLLANLPVAPPFKVGVVLVLVQAIGAYGAYILTSLLHGTPVVLFGSIALILLICFANLTQGRGFLPILLVLISFSTVPIVTMAAPQDASVLPFAFTQAMSVAVATVWLAHAIWPRVSPPAAPAARPVLDSHFALALSGVAIVVPVMLVYLMYGITDALPVLITTVVLVINFDPRRGAMQAMAMMIGNFIGGLVAIAAYAVLQIAPSLPVLALVAFFIALPFAVRIEQGGPRGAVALVTFNQAMIMFSLSLAPGGASPSLWTSRLIQFGVASIFAVGMMSLLWPRLGAATSQDGE